MKKLIALNICSNVDASMILTVLEKYVAIIFALAQQGPLKAVQLESVTHIDIITLEKYLVFLTKQGAIEEQQPKNLVMYAATSTGLKILDFFNLSKSFEAHKNNV